MINLARIDDLNIEKLKNLNFLINHCLKDKFCDQQAIMKKFEEGILKFINKSDMQKNDMQKNEDYLKMSTKFIDEFKSSNPASVTLGRLYVYHIFKAINCCIKAHYALNPHSWETQGKNVPLAQKNYKKALILNKRIAQQYIAVLNNKQMPKALQALNDNLDVKPMYSVSLLFSRQTDREPNQNADDFIKKTTFSDGHTAGYFGFKKMQDVLPLDDDQLSVGDKFN